MSAESEIDEKIPTASVLAAVERLLDEAEWRLEFDEGILAIPRDPAPLVASRAFIKAHAPDIVLGDHYEAVIYLAPAIMGSNWVPTAGSLKLYFDRSGQFVSLDRFPPPS
jgi:hypothetical protein